ncbi:hypothetical protein BDV59DRAFT_109124 [Aspergillus ambiguus]|uniref:uncharacterized protein n=1 Tax=Aspergillus ambiguus TaxID=176160 RepID=UPI003CCC98D5
MNGEGGNQGQRNTRTQQRDPSRRGGDESRVSPTRTTGRYRNELSSRSKNTGWRWTARSGSSWGMDRGPVQCAAYTSSRRP